MESHLKQKIDQYSYNSVEIDFRSDAPEGYFLTTDYKKSFYTEYVLLETIGKGSYSEVKKCRHKHTGQYFIQLMLPLYNYVFNEIQNI